MLAPLLFSLAPQWSPQFVHSRIASGCDIFQIVRSRENHKKGLKDNYGRLIDFRGQISKLFYFNLLDLADF